MLEVVRVRVAEGAAETFVRAVRDARHRLDAAPGFRSLSVQRCVEEPNLLVLLMHWRGWSDVESFRRSPAHEEFRTLIDRHIIGAEVRHFEQAEVEGKPAEPGRHPHEAS